MDGLHGLGGKGRQACLLLFMCHEALPTICSPQTPLWFSLFVSFRIGSVWFSVGLLWLPLFGVVKKHLCAIIKSNATPTYTHTHTHRHTCCLLLFTRL